MSMVELYPTQSGLMITPNVRADTVSRPGTPWGGTRDQAVKEDGRAMRAKPDAAVAATPDPAPGLLTVTEAARLGGVSRWTISGWIARGSLPATLLDRRRRIRPADLVAARDRAHASGVVPAWRQDRTRAGQRLRTLREAAGLTQLELAERSGVTHETISRLERGRPAPLVRSVHKLARALEVAPAQFVGPEALMGPGMPVAEAARLLGVPAGRLRRWLVTGAIAGTKVSGQWRVSAPAVTALLASGRLRGYSRRLDPRYRG